MADLRGARALGRNRGPLALLPRLAAVVLVSPGLGVGVDMGHFHRAGDGVERYGKTAP